MKQLLNKAGIVVGYAILMLIALTMLFWIAGGLFNVSGSIPTGLYWITKRPVQTGEYVLFCPPQKAIFDEALTRGYIRSGFCPGGFGYLMKRVLGVHGDTVSITPQGVLVNNRLIKHSVPFQKDEQERPLPRLVLNQYRLKKSELLLMTEQSALSFDARYFGLIQRSQVKAVIKPVLTWSLTS